MTKTQSQMESQLRASGRRLTTERKLLLQIIENNPHLDANQIYDIARSQNPRIGLATVYRTLSVLKELGIVQTSELGEDRHHYEIHRDEHVHLVCESCGAVIELPTPINIEKPASSVGFDVHHVRVEITGLCHECRKAARSRSRQTPSHNKNRS